MTCPVCVSVTAITGSLAFGSLPRGKPCFPRAGGGSRAATLRHIRRPAWEAGIQRVLVRQGFAAGTKRADVRQLAERLDDDVADLAEVLFVHSAHRRRRSSDPYPARDRRRPL